MSDAEIEQAMRDARQYAGQDSLRRDALELISEAQTLLSQTQQSLKKAGKQIDKEEKKQIKKDAASLQKLLAKFRVDKVTEEQVADIRRSKEQLESSGANVRANYV
jgi:molecular chaperone DnaK